MEISAEACLVLAAAAGGMNGAEIVRLLDARGFTRRWQARILNEAIAHLERSRQLRG